MFACGEPRRAQGRSVGTRSLRPRPRVCARRAWRPVTRPFGSAILGNPAGAERASKQAPKALPGLPQAPRPLAGVKASTPPAKVEASVLPGSTQDGASAATGGRPGLPLRRGSESHTGPPSPKPRGHAAGPPAGPSPPHLPVLGFLLQGSLVQPVHRMRGRGWEVVAAQAAPLLHLGAVVWGAVAHAWGGGEGFRLEF